MSYAIIAVLGSKALSGVCFSVAGAQMNKPVLAGLGALYTGLCMFVLALLA